MKYRFYFLFIFFTVLFLFYPGDSFYFHLFAYNRKLFAKTDIAKKIVVQPIPRLSNPYYPEVSAEGIYIVDLTSFTPIMERNPKESFFPASTTKIMTALVAADNFKPYDIVTVKRNIEEGQVMNLKVGEKITVENLLYGILVHSANDAAYALADYLGYDRFIAEMNLKAQQLKMTRTHFENPAGLDDPNQITSPFDLALASRALLKNNYLAKFVATKDITISDVDFKYFHHLSNVNKLLGEIQGIGGLKTGYTENAGENLVSFYKHEGHQFVIVILKSSDRFFDTRNIIKWIDENVAYEEPPTL